MEQITFGNYTVTTWNFFVITIHYVNAVLTPTVFDKSVITVMPYIWLLA